MELTRAQEEGYRSRVRGCLLVWEFTANHLLHGEYGPWTRWSKRYRGG